MLASPLTDTPLRSELAACLAAAGETLWKRECYYWTYGSPPDVFVIDGLVWVHDAKPYAMMGLDLASGKERKRFSTTKAMRMTHHHRCYREKATERLTCLRVDSLLDILKQSPQFPTARKRSGNFQ